MNGSVAGGAPLRLRCVAETVLPARSPFHFLGTVRKPSRFPAAVVAYDGDRYWQTLTWHGRPLGLCLQPANAAGSVRLRVWAEHERAAEDLEAVAAEVTRRLDLDGHLGAFVQRFSTDPVAGVAVERWGGMRAGSPYSLYEYLVVAMVLQNTTVRRSRAMLQALLQRFGSMVDCGGVSLHAFWEPSRLLPVGEDELRSLRLGYRAGILSRMTRDFVEGGLDRQDLRQLDSQSLARRLQSLHGVGPVSTWYVMLDVFQRYDWLPLVPTWESKIFSRLLGIPGAGPDRLAAEMTRQWAPWQRLAAHYAFEDLFWRHQRDPVGWLGELIRL